MRRRKRSSFLPLFLIGLFGIFVFGDAGIAAQTAPKVLLLYQQKSKPVAPGILGIPESTILLSNLLGHFRPEITRAPVENYTTGAMQDYDYVFYYGDLAKAKLPNSFLDDIPKYREVTVVWVKHNIDQLLAKYPTTYAFKALPPQGGFTEITYNNQTYKREDVDTISPIQVSRWEGTKTYGILQSRTGISAFSVHSDNLWFFPDFAAFGIPNLVFADLLHDVFQTPHEINPQFFIRLEDIHPLRDAKRLRENCEGLRNMKVPFMLSVIPQYRQPGKKEPVYLKQSLHLVETIQDCVQQGGSVLMHGQTFQYEDEAGEGHEFWDVEKDKPYHDYNENIVHDKMIRGIQSLVELEIYPIAWETPYYAADEQSYQVIAQHFSTAVEQRQISDRTYKATQTFPYIVQDIYGQTIVPENLGYVNLETGETIEKKLKTAAPYKIVRDAVVGVYYHSYFELKYLQMLAEGLKQMNFKPLDLRDIPNVVVGDDIAIFTGLATEPYPLLEPAKALVASEKDPRLLKISLSNQYLHTFQVDYRNRILANYWANRRIQGTAVVQIPSKYHRMFVVEASDSTETIAKKAQKLFRKFVIGRTGAPLETIQRWIVWTLFLGNVFFIFFIAGILIVRSSYHASHFRKRTLR